MRNAGLEEAQAGIKISGRNIKGTIKDRNGKELTEAEEIKRGLQEYTELYKKDLNDLANHNDVVTHLEPEARHPGV